MKPRYWTGLFIILSLFFSAFPSFAWGGEPPRDIQYHWAGNYINTLIENGIMSGYENGRFRPDRGITREELAALLFSYAKQQGRVSEEDARVFATTVVEPSDLTSEWSKLAVNYLVSQGVITVDSNNAIYPEEIMQRDSFAQMIYRFKTAVEGYEFKPIVEGEPSPFTDLDGSPAKTEILALHRAGIISGYEDHSFLPKQKITRAEVATLLQKMSDLPLTEMKKTLPAYRIIDVPYISQVYPVSAMVGCEGASLLMGLHSKGYAPDMDLRQFLDQMPRHTSNPAKGFVGSPYKPDKTKKTRTTIFPQSLANFGGQYGKVSNVSGSLPSELQAEILYGNPVVIYATMNWEKPYYRSYNVEGTTMKFLSNNHAVLVCGYDTETNRYYIADPYNIKNPGRELKYWIEGGTFERIYNERRHGVLVE